MRKSIWTVILVCGIVLTVVAAAAAIVFGSNEYTLPITLNGEREITLEYGQDYEEPGATAMFQGTLVNKKPTQVEVTVSGDVDTGKLGTYTIRYSARHMGFVATQYRRVRVVDTQLPEITLVADPEKFTFPNETYQEEGFSATDNYDGDITDRVVRTETRETVTYTVKDSSGNTATVERQIVYDDPVPPELKLKGDKTVTVTAGHKYVEPGYTATDNCDGDLTGKVAVTGNVDIYKPGYYTLIYSVKDAYENLVSVSRTVYVKPRSNESVAPPTVVVPNGKVIYLTFDDGPGPRTPELLDILKKYNVKATFFVVNTKYINTIKRASEEGHAIAIHSATHVFREIYASEDAYFKDLYKMQDIIKNITGKETTLIRFPGGSSNTVSSFNPGIMTRLTRMVVDKGFQYFDWNVDSNDAGGATTAEQVFNNVVQGIGNKKTSIVLQHDIKGFSIEAVERIIIWGLENGYTFLPLDPTSPGSHHGINN